MSDDQDTTAPGRVGITIKRVEVTTGDDPYRFVNSLTAAIKREMDKPADEFPGYRGTSTYTGRVVGLFYVPWRRRIRKAAFIVAGAGVIALAIIGALSLF